MRGKPSLNFPEFNRVATILRSFGHEVFNPAEHDVAEGFDPDVDEPKDLKHYMAHDLAAVCNSDAVAVLDDWEDSVGARLEVHVAHEVDIPVYDYMDVPFAGHRAEPDVEAPTAYVGPTEDAIEVRTTSSTGGEKGKKLAQYDQIPADALNELAEHYGKGSAKYSKHNFRKGYEWSLSFSAAMRHLWQFWGGEDIDEETGSKHVTAAAWHCLNLATLMDEHPNFDDRYVKGGEG